MSRIVLCLMAAALLVAPAQAAAMRALGSGMLGEDLGLHTLPRGLGGGLGRGLGGALGEGRAPEPRLPLPSPAELEAIAKVAQILVTLGQQVIPAIIGEPAPTPAAPANCDIPNDPVKE